MSPHSKSKILIIIDIIVIVHVSDDVYLCIGECEGGSRSISVRYVILEIFGYYFAIWLCM